MKKIFFLMVLVLAVNLTSIGQSAGADGKILAPTPPMGWMTWNYFADKINEKDIREMADAMVSSGMLAAGYQYVFIDDGWQGGRDNKNNLIADPRKIPSGIEALADYVHSKGLKLGIYSDAAQLTCAGYTGSLNFEEQDAKIFAAWGVDYLKYDYCNAPDDSTTAKLRYKTIASALHNSGGNIALGICEWGDRMPWLWAANAGGQLWRTTADVRDKWNTARPYTKAKELHSAGAGILDIVDFNAGLWQYAGPGRWNDMDMLVVGLNGRKGPSGDLGGIGCSEVEYQSQMSLWCMLASPLAATNDVRNMNDATKRILLNKEIIEINQDELGKQAERKISNETWNVFLKPLANGDYTVAILNRSDTPQKFSLAFSDIGLYNKYKVRDVWAHTIMGNTKKWTGVVKSHETRVFRLKKK
jgi:alpha-galactosidase